MNYNPYDLVPLLINGKPITGRPFMMDSDVVDQKTMKNAFGVLVKPSKVMTLCPDCLQGLEVDVKLGEPPFKPVVYSCKYCKPAPAPSVDPFVNPVKTGRVPAQELDPILHDPMKPLAETKGTVADRFQVPIETPIAAPAPIPQPSPRRPRKKPKTGTLPGKPTANTTKQAPDPVVAPPAISDPFTLTKHVARSGIEPAEGMGEEVDFDDSSMVEDV